MKAICFFALLIALSVNCESFEPRILQNSNSSVEEVKIDLNSPVEMDMGGLYS